MIGPIPYDPALSGEIVDLMASAFGGEARCYYEQIIRYLYDEPHAFLLGEKGRLVSNALVVDYVDAEGGRWGYLYSLVTDEAYRGRGLMTQLYHEQIEPALRAAGYRGVCLVPASSRLVTYYEGWGMELQSTAPGEERMPLVPGPMAVAYLRSVYGKERILNPLPYRMWKAYDPTVQAIELISPLD